MKRYSYKAAEQAIEYLASMGYTPIQVDDGTLGIGHWIILAPDDKHYNVEIQEHYLNEWSSYHTIRNFDKVSKRIQALLS